MRDEGALTPDPLSGRERLPSHQMRARLHETSDGGPIDLVLLDLRLGCASGFDLLALLKSDAALRRAYDLGANAYMVKPAAFEDLVRLLEGLQTFWFELARLATHAD